MLEVNLDCRLQASLTATLTYQTGMYIKSIFKRWSDKHVFWSEFWGCSLVRKGRRKQMPSPWFLLNRLHVWPSHISSQPVSDYPSPAWQAECSPPASPCHVLPSFLPPSTPCWQPGQGRWPNLSVKVPSPRGNTTDTNYHTAGARPGNRMATTWSNQGTQQQGPEKANKSECVCLWVCVSVQVYCGSIYKLSKTEPVNINGFQR